MHETSCEDENKINSSSYLGRICPNSNLPVLDRDISPYFWWTDACWVMSMLKFNNNTQWIRMTFEWAFWISCFYNSWDLSSDKKLLLIFTNFSSNRFPLKIKTTKNEYKIWVKNVMKTHGHENKNVKKTNSFNSEFDFVFYIRSSFCVTWYVFVVFSSA